MKKKAIKIAAASAVAASAFVASAPLQSNAASNVATTVDQAVMTMQKAYHTYGDVTANGQFADLADVYKAYNAAKVAYNNAKAVVNKAGGAQKDLYLAKLDSNYNELIAKRVVTYIDAYNYAKSLEGLKDDLNAALTAKAWDDAEGLYHKISYELKTRTVILDRVYGQSTRELLRSTFKASAQSLRDSIAQPVTAKIAIAAATKAVEAKDADGAKKQLDKAAAALKLADANSEFTKDLNTKYATANTAYGALVSPTVVSATAVNAKTIEVKFSSAVDAKTATVNNVDLITVVTANTSAHAPGAVTQTWSEDGTTLTLAAADYFKGDYTVKVPFETIKGTNGKFVAAVNQAVTANDTVAPELVSAKATVKATTDKVTKVTLSFNEVVQAGYIVKIDGQGYSVNASGKTATIDITGTGLDASKTYDVTVLNAKDVVGNAKEEQKVALNIVVDNAAPSVTGIEVTGENTVKVTLDKVITGDLKALATAGSFTAKVGTFTTNIITDVVQNPENSKEYTVTLSSSYLYAAGATSATVNFTVAKEVLVDALGNKNAAEITKQVTVSKDTVAPTITKVDTTEKDGKTTSFTVNFSEAVNVADATKVYVVNSKGEIVPVSTVATAAVDPQDAKKVVFTLVNGAKADTYSIDLLEGFATDKSLASNKNAKYSFQVTVKDAAAPTVTTYEVKSVTENGGNSYTVDFGKVVKATGTGNALDASLYSVNGVVLPASTSIEFVKNADGSVDQTKVVVKLAADTIAKNDANVFFRVNGVQTIDGKTNVPYSKIVAVTDNTAPVLTSFVATDLAQLTLTYSEAVALATPAQGTLADITDELKLYDANGALVTITGWTISSGKLVLTVDANKAASVAKVTTVKTTGFADIVDANGIKQKDGVTVNK